MNKYKLNINIEIDNNEITGDSSYIIINKQTKYGPLTIKFPSETAETINHFKNGKLCKIYNIGGWEIDEIVQNSHAEKKHTWGDAIAKEIDRRIELENRIERKETEISKLYNTIRRLENIIEHSTLDTSS